jgi:hypothetical protein
MSFTDSLLSRGIERRKEKRRNGEEPGPKAGLFATSYRVNARKRSTR